MSGAQTAADKDVSGYVRNERITLATSPTGTTHAWSLTRPAGSSTAELTDDTAAGPSFVPDVAGTYVVTCTVDGTTAYVITISVVAPAVSEPVEPLRFPPYADSQIPTPTLGVILYYSSTQSSLAIKTSAGVVRTVDTTAIP